MIIDAAPPFTTSMDGHGPGTLQVTPDSCLDGISLRLTGELDIATAPHLVETMRSLSASDLRHVRLDLAGLDFIDGSGLGALVQVRMLVHGPAGRLTLHGVRPLLLRLLMITNLRNAFDLESSLATPGDR